MKFINSNTLSSLLVACVLFCSTDATANIINLNFGFDDVRFTTISESGNDGLRINQENIFSPGRVNLKLLTDIQLEHIEVPFPPTTDFALTSYQTVYRSQDISDSSIEFTLQSEWDERFNSYVSEIRVHQDVRQQAVVYSDLYDFFDPLVNSELWTTTLISSIDIYRIEAVIIGDVDSGNYISIQEEKLRTTVIRSDYLKIESDDLEEEAARPREMDDFIKALQTSQETKFTSEFLNRWTTTEYVDGIEQSANRDYYIERYTGVANLVDIVSVSEPSTLAVILFSLVGLIIRRLKS